MPHPYLVGASTPRVLAHRGFVSPDRAVAGITENTRASIAAAVAAGAEYVETDCHLTLDSHVVLFHDPDLARVTGDPRPIAEATRAELENLMQDRGGLTTLEDALAEFPDTRFNIDVKAEAAAVPMGRILASHGHRTLLTSFSDDFRKEALRSAAESAAPGGILPATSPGRSVLARVLIAVAIRSRSLLARALSGLDALQIPERHGMVPVLSRWLIAEAHWLGVEVHVWTVNDPQRMVELVELGVDGIITDRLDLGLEAFERA